MPDSLTAAVGDDYGAFVRSQASNLVGRPLDVDIKRADGTDVRTELVISIFDHPLAGPVVVGIIRPRDEKKLQRWSELTSELLEILADAPVDEPPAERILSTLGRRLDWDVTTLWALSADQELVCRHVWTRSPSIAPAFTREKAGDPTSGSEGLPRWVLRARRASVGRRPRGRSALRHGRAGARTGCRAPTPSRSATTGAASGSSRC